MGLSSLLQRLLFVNQFSIIEGRVEVLGNRYIMLDSSDILALQEIDKTKAYNSVKNASKENLKNMVSHAEVYRSIKNQSLKNIAELSKKIGKSDEGVIKTLQSIFEIYGLGKMSIIDLNNSEKKAIVRIDQSSLALAKLKTGKSKTPTCTLTCGILAGIFSYIFGKDVDCIENKCKSQGNSYCDLMVS